MPSGTVVTSRPSGTVQAGGWTRTGGTTVHGVLADDSNSTYLSTTSSRLNDSDLTKLDVTDFTVPSGAKVFAVQIRYRVQGTSVWDPDAVYIWSYLSGKTKQWVNTVPYSGSSAWKDVSLGYTTEKPGGGEWLAADVNAMQVWLGKGTSWFGDSVKVSEIWVDVDYNERPVVVVTAPSGSLTDIDQPTVTWTWTDPEGDSQEAYEIEIRNSATPGAGTLYWASGEVLSAAISKQIGIHLANGTYYAHVRARQQWEGIGTHWSAWAVSASFTVNVSPPVVPEISATPNTALSRVSVAVCELGNRLSANQASFETDTSGWSNSTNCTISQSAAQALNGTKSLAMTSTASGAMRARTSDAGTVPVSVGEQITVSAYLRAAVTPQQIRVRVRWCDSAGVLLLEEQNTAVESDTTSGWTRTSCTKTAPVSPAGIAKVGVNVEVMNTSAASEVHYVDQVQIQRGGLGTWIAGGLSAEVFNLEFSDDVGITWASLRNGLAVAPSGGCVTVLDYEAPPSLSRMYRANARRTVNGNPVASAYASTSATLTVVASWLKVPLNPALNTTVRINQRSSVARGRDTVLRPKGRRTAVVVSDVVGGFDDRLRMISQTSVEYTALRNLLLSTQVLLYQRANGTHRYIRIVGDRPVAEQGADPHGLVYWDVDAVEVSRP